MLLLLRSHSGDVGVGHVVEGAVAADEVDAVVGGRSCSGLVAEVVGDDPCLLSRVVHQRDLGALSVHVHHREHPGREVRGCDALADPVDEEDEVSLRRPQNPDPVVLLQLVQVCAVVFVYAPPVLEDGVSGHDP